MGGSINITGMKNILKDYNEYNIFVESGTFIAKTTKKMSRLFNKVKTIEINKDIYEVNLQLYNDIKNIDFYLGDSREVLPSIIKEIKNQTGVVFFLDGHYSSDLNIPKYLRNKYRNSFFTYRWNIPTGTAEDTNVPLLEELRIISENFNEECIIIIDDFRLFEDHRIDKRKHSHGDWSEITKKKIFNIVQDRSKEERIEDDKIIIKMNAKVIIV